MAFVEATGGSLPPPAGTPDYKYWNGIKFNMNDPDDKLTYASLLQWDEGNELAKQQSGGSAPAYSTTAEGIRLQAKLAADENAKQRSHESTLQKSGYSFDKMLQDDRIDADKARAALDRSHALRMQKNDQEFQIGRDEFQAELQRDLQQAGFDHATAERIASQAWSTEERIAEQDFQRESQIIQQKFEERMQQQGFDFQAGESEKTREFSAGESEKDREFQREQQQKELELERQRQVVELMGRDPVRAVMLALGAGGDVLPGGESFEGLGAMKGAEEKASQTSQALSGLTGKEVQVGKEGVQGLGGKEGLLKQARTLQSGATGEQAKRLLSSAFGVGSTAQGQQTAGISGEEQANLVQQVTPTGALRIG